MKKLTLGRLGTLILAGFVSTTIIGCSNTPTTNNQGENPEKPSNKPGWVVNTSPDCLYQTISNHTKDKESPSISGDCAGESEIKKEVK